MTLNCLSLNFILEYLYLAEMRKKERKGLGLGFENCGLGLDLDLGLEFGVLELCGLDLG